MEVKRTSRKESTTVSAQHSLSRCKTLLVYSISAAYVQLFWRTLRKEKVEIARIDSLFDLLKSAIEFRHLHVWTNFPALAVAALISWYDLSLTCLSPLHTDTH
jgi:hypothetical protein